MNYKRYASLILLPTYFVFVCLYIFLFGVRIGTDHDNTTFTPITTITIIGSEATETWLLGSLSSGFLINQFIIHFLYFYYCILNSANLYYHIIVAMDILILSPFKIWIRAIVISGIASSDVRLAARHIIIIINYIYNNTLAE